MSYKRKITNSISIIHKALLIGKGVVAFSGGKDGLAAAILINKISPNIEMVCETSFYFPKQLADIKQTAKKLGFNVTYLCSLSDDWLMKNKKVLFTTSTKVRQWSFSVRQQRTMKKFAIKVGASVTFTGRRTQENNVPDYIYSTKKNGVQAHPLKDWTTEDIWEFINDQGLEKPFIYTTKWGEQGNSPFYSYNPRKSNKTISECWQLVDEIDGGEFNKKFNNGN
jgi:3'-phosphoadenosine 5'-phosphosulfate sulfotransferase (PAPS reductase)/FAD synthetase